MAWLRHVEALEYFVDSAPEGSIGLIIEDDVDWDTRIHESIPKVEEAIRDLTHVGNDPDPNGAQRPYGSGWDLLWLGHCGDSFPFSPMVHFHDDTVPPRNRIKTWNKDLLALPEGTRTAHYSTGPICTFAYAVTIPTARKIISYAMDAEAYDIRLSIACRIELRCITINPEVFHHHEPLGAGRSSDIEAMNEGQLKEVNDFSVASTANIRNSARCATNPAIRGPCLQD